MRDEVRGVGRVVGDVLVGTVGVIEDVQRAVAGRWFAGLGRVARPVQVIHDGIAVGVYATVRAADAGVPRVVSAVVASCVPVGAPSVSDARAGRLVLGAVNGLWGDTLTRRYPEFAARHAGAVSGPRTCTSIVTGSRWRSLACSSARCVSARIVRNRRVVVAAGDRPTGRLWKPSAARPWGYTPVYLRYNSGLRVFVRRACKLAAPPRRSRSMRGR